MRNVSDVGGCICNMGETVLTQVGEKKKWLQTEDTLLHVAVSAMMANKIWNRRRAARDLGLGLSSPLNPWLGLKITISGTQSKTWPVL